MHARQHSTTGFRALESSAEDIPAHRVGGGGHLWQARRCVVALALVLLSSPHCSENQSEGGHFEQCFPNQTCHDGLDCRDWVCVPMADVGQPADVSSDGDSSADATSAECGKCVQVWYTFTEVGPISNTECRIMGAYEPDQPRGEELCCTGDANWYSGPCDVDYPCGEECPKAWYNWTLCRSVTQVKGVAVCMDEDAHSEDIRKADRGIFCAPPEMNCLVLPENVP